MPFQDLLIKDKSFSIPHQNIHILLIEIYKAKNNLRRRNLIREWFVRNDQYYNLCSKSKLLVGYTYLVTGNSIPVELRKAGFYHVFKSELKKNCEQTNYPCRLCKDYIENLKIFY